MTDLCCSFCGSSRSEVEKLIAGPGVTICNVCTGLCSDILDEEKVERGTRGTRAVTEWAFEKVKGRAVMDEPKALEREPNVVNLVANLRARCAAARARNPCGEAVVVLTADLVDAIADGIEMAAQGPSLDDDFAPSETTALAKQAVKDIVKLVVTRLFATAKAEGERALDACEQLGFDEKQVGAIVAPQGMLPVSSMLALGIAGVLPMIWAMLRGHPADGQKGGLGG